MTWMIHVEATWKSSLRDSVSNRAFSKFKALLSLTNASPLSFTLSLSHRLEHSHSQSTLLALLIHSHSLSVTDANLDPLSLSQPHRRRPSLTLSLSHSPTQSHASVSHPLHPHTDTLSPSLLSHSPSLLLLSVHYFTFISFAKRIEMYQTVIIFCGRGPFSYILDHFFFSRHFSWVFHEIIRRIIWLIWRMSLMFSEPYGMVQWLCTLLDDMVMHLLALLKFLF